MTFTSHASLADVAASAAPRRERNDEQLEVTRRARFDEGLCRDCTRKRRKTGALCGHCRNRIERNTVRDPGKQSRRGRLVIGESDAADLKLAIQALCAGASGLERVANAHSKLTRFERQHAEGEPMSQLLLAVKSMFELAERRGVTAEWLIAIRRSLAD